MQVAFGIVAAKEIHHDPRGKMMGKGIKLFHLFNFFMEITLISFDM